MLTDEDFEKAENALKAIDGWIDSYGVMGIVDANMVIISFARKVLSEARRDFLTDKKVVISKMEIVQTIPKITPMK